MLEVQQYLREKAAAGLDPLAELERELFIRVTRHPSDSLAILNYCMIDSPKRHPITQECRGLCLEVGSWDVAARAFARFFNAGECPDLEKKFDWTSFSAESKEDGSLSLLYRRNGEWRVNTRGSFAQGEIAQGVGKTWEQVFYEGFDEDGRTHGLDWMRAILTKASSRSSSMMASESSTFVFELCSPYNKVVRRYDKPTLFLLTAFHNCNGAEWGEINLDITAEAMGVERPTRFDFRTLKDVQSYLEAHEDPTFEGVVLRDRKGMRLKVKNARYVALHHMADNGNIFAAKRLLPFALKGEGAELLSYFPEVAANYYDLVEKLYGSLGRLQAVWEQAKGLPSQKEFALYVTKHTPLASVLFDARKAGIEPKAVFLRSEDRLIRHLEAS